MHDRTHVDFLEEVPGRSRVGQVARRQPDLRARLGQIPDQVGRTRRARPAPADQEQVLDAVPGDQMPGHGAAERTGGAGENHGSGAEVGQLRIGHRRDQPGRQHHPVADRDLRQPGLDDAGHQLLRVDQGEPAGILALRRPDQTPERGAGQPGHRLGRAGRDRAAGVHHEMRSAAGRIENQPLQDFQYGVDRVPGRARLGRVQHEGRRLGQRLAEPHAAPPGRAGIPVHRHRAPLDGPQAGGGRRERAQRDTVDPPDRQTGAVGEIEAHPVGAVRGEPDQQGRRAGGDQSHPAEGERQPHGVHQARGPDRVQRAVQQRRVQGESGPRFGNLDLGEDLVAGPPDTAQPLEGGTVAEAGGGHRRVEVAERDLLGGGRNRHRAQLDVVVRGEQAVRVLDPRVVRAGPGVDGHRSAPVVRRRPDRDPDLRRQFQRRLQEQLVQHRDTRRGARHDSHLGQGRAGDDRAVVDGVVEQPRVGGGGERAGEQDQTGAGDLGAGAQDGVAGAGQAETGDVAGDTGPGPGPEAAVLERVGGQRNGRAADDRGPVDGLALDVELRDSGQQRADLRPVASHRRDGGQVRVDVRDQAGQHAVRA